MKYDGIGIKVNLVQSMECVGWKRCQYEYAPDLCISYADVPSFLFLHGTATSRAVKSKVLHTCQQLEFELENHASRVPVLLYSGILHLAFEHKFSNLQ